jgi:hypothetical protein
LADFSTKLDRVHKDFKDVYIPINNPRPLLSLACPDTLRWARALMIGETYDFKNAVERTIQSVLALQGACVKGLLR